MTTTYNGLREVDNHPSILEVIVRMNNVIVRAGLRLPYDLNTWLILEAKKHGIPKNALILQILWNWMEQKENEDLKVKK